MIYVEGPKTKARDGALRLSVASHAAAMNPPEWRDLWRLSPFSVPSQPIAVPGLAGIHSRTVENAWQLLKVWNEEEGWNEALAMSCFESTCAVRFPRGRGTRAIGHWWGESESVIDYATARARIYLQAYSQLLEFPSRRSIIGRLRIEAESRDIAIWDYDSYCLQNHSDDQALFDTIINLSRPFAHAFIVAIAVRGKMEEFRNYIAEAIGGKP